MRWKECDKECNLCPCSTATDTVKEHCSGHGTCVASSCTQKTCSNAKCYCNPGWKGDKCELKGKYNKKDKKIY